MTKTISTILGLTMTLAMAGVSFAQTTPAPAPKTASTTMSTTKSTKTKHATKSTTAKAKGTKKAAAVTPAK